MSKAGVGNGRRQQEIVALEEAAHLLAELVAREYPLVVLLDRLVERVLQHRGHGGVDDVAVLGQRLLQPVPTPA